MIRTVALAGETEIPAVARPINSIRLVWRIFQSSRRLEGNIRACARDRERPDGGVGRDPGARVVAAAWPQGGAGARTTSAHQPGRSPTPIRSCGRTTA